MLYNHILIDGRHLLFRAAATMGGLGVEMPLDGTLPTGAMYGFLRVVLSIYDKHAAGDDTRLTVCWEGGYTARKALHPDYKSNRRVSRGEQVDAMILTMNDQEQVLKGMLSLAGWDQAWARGWEADDVMATLAARGAEPTAIYTGDHDLHQCVTRRVDVLSPNRKHGRGQPDFIRWDEAAVRAKWGVDPVRIPEVKALEGDSSDNIPGCPGIGAVWARKLLATLPSIEGLLALAESGEIHGIHEGKPWSSKRHAGLIVDNIDIIRTSRELATVNRDAPVERLPASPDSQRLVEAFRAFQFTSLLRPTVLNTIKAIGHRSTPCH
jgi:5'-3' exonuclease